MPLSPDEIAERLKRVTSQAKWYTKESLKAEFAGPSVIPFTGWIAQRHDHVTFSLSPTGVTGKDLRPVMHDIIDGRAAYSTVTLRIRPAVLSLLSTGMVLLMIMFANAVMVLGLIGVLEGGAAPFMFWLFPLLTAIFVGTYHCQVRTFWRHCKPAFDFFSDLESTDVKGPESGR